MPAQKYLPGELNRTLACEIIKLETRLVNIQYLLALPDVTEAQKQQLRPLFLRTEAELTDIYDAIGLPA
jgi:hypothetical protein